MTDAPITGLAAAAGMGWQAERREEMARVVTIRASLPDYQTQAIRLFYDASAAGATARAILMRLFAGQVASPFTIRGLRRRNLGQLRDYDALRQAVALLAALGFLWSERDWVHGRATIWWHVNEKAFRIPQPPTPKVP